MPGRVRLHEVRRTAMNAIKATVRDGRLEVQVPPDWPDGTEVILQPVSPEHGVGIREEDWPDTPEAVAEWLRWYDSLEPLIFTDAERAALESDRKARREWEKAHFDEHADKLRGMWQ
jgi:hypothetical protein